MTEQSEQLISLFLQSPLAMTEQQRQELSAWIIQSPGNTEQFIQASLFNRCIHEVLLGSDVARKRILQLEDTSVPDDASESFDKQLWEMLLKEEQTAPEIEIERPVPEKEPIRYVRPERIQRKINKTSLLTSLVAIAALLVLIIYVQLVPKTVEVEVATLTNTVNAQWAQSAGPKNSNTRLMTNHDPLMLRKGYAELVFDNNAKVVLEAPVEFQVLSYDQIKLSYGRLYATVPKEALGFIVSTPTSKIIDLGTEFGVKTDFNGATELHVVKGKTSLVSGLDDKKISILLNAGSAKKITTNDSSPINILCDKKLFARQIDSKSQFVWKGQNISLADIVGGGNGFGTGEKDKGVAPLTGSMTQTLSNNSVYLGPKDYVPVLSSPYIDGVFVPGVNEGLTKIASIGIQTDEFPKTSSQTWGYIFDGAWHQADDVPRHHLQLNGIELGDKENPAITMHPNMGMTFDLSAIREKCPNLKINSFSSTFGVSETVEKWIKFDFEGWEQTPELTKLAKERHSSAEFWVFLDGKKVLRQKLFSTSNPGVIDVPIDKTVRFLTLAVTEADDTFMFDWTVFARPELVLEAVDK